MLDPEGFHLFTERLHIRALTPDDVPAAFRVMADGFGMAHETEARDYVLDTIARLRLQHRLMQPPYGDFALLDPAGALVGMAGYTPSYGPFGLLPYFQHLSTAEATAALSTPEWGLFWVLREEVRGRGYATEAVRALIDHAFAQFGLLRVVATTETDNAASIAVMRRLGMIIEQNPRPTPAWFQVIGILKNPSAPADA